MKPLLLILWWLPILAFAGEPPEDDLNFTYRGFLSQSFIKTAHNNLYGNSSKGSFGRREAGLTFSASPLENLDLRGFIKYEEMGDRLKDSPVTPRYLLADFHSHAPTPFIGQTGVRAGYVANEIGFYNTVREDPTLRDQDLASQGVYRDTLKNFINGGIGYQLYTNTDALPFININVEFSKVKPQFVPKDDVLSAWFPVVPSGQFSAKDADATGYHLGLMSKDYQWQFRYDRYDVTAIYQAGFNDIVPSGDLSIRVQTYAFRYYAEEWDLTYEYLTDDLTGKDWQKITHPAHSRQAVGTNLTLRYRFSPKWTVSLGHGTWVSDKNDPKGERAGKSLNTPPSSYYLKDTMLAVKYNPSNSWILKGEVHFQQGTVQLSPIDNPPNKSRSSSDTVFMTSITYQF